MAFNLRNCTFLQEYRPDLREDLHPHALFAQAENRMNAIEAIVVATLGD